MIVKQNATLKQNATRTTGCTGCRHRWPLPNKPDCNGRSWIKCMETGQEVLERDIGECPVQTMIGYIPKLGGLR